MNGFSPIVNVHKLNMELQHFPNATTFFDLEDSQACVVS